MRNKFVVNFAVTMVLAFGALSQGQDAPPRVQNDSKITDESHVDNQPSVSDGVLVEEASAVPSEEVAPVELVSPVAPIEPVSDGSVEPTPSNSIVLLSVSACAPICGGCARVSPACSSCPANCGRRLGCVGQRVRLSARPCQHVQCGVSNCASSSGQLPSGSQSIGLVSYHQPVQDAVTVPTTVEIDSMVMFATGNPAVFGEFSGLPSYSAPPVPSCETCCEANSRVRIGARRCATGCSRGCSSCDAGPQTRIRGRILRRR
jgi:hypothetical protein